MRSKALKIESSLYPGDRIGTDGIVEHTTRLEALGFDRVFTAETGRDAFHPLILAAHATERLELGTGIVVAFGRNPMTVAIQAHDLQMYSNGRFRLGLGSQIKPHITRRFGMPWHGAAKQMREFVEAIGAIFDTWYDGTKLDYRGEFYQHTLMTPNFVPVTEGLERPPILLAAVGPLMLKTAAECADGLIIHPFCTEQYLKDVIVPKLEPALEARGKTLEDFEIQYPIFMAAGETEEELEAAKDVVKQRLGFYGSTPAYKPVLDLHGWGDLQPKLNQMTKDGRWDELAGEITDEMVETFAAVGTYADAAQIVRERIGGVADSVVLNAATPAEHLETQMSILRAD